MRTHGPPQGFSSATAVTRARAANQVTRELPRAHKTRPIVGTKANNVGHPLRFRLSILASRHSDFCRSVISHLYVFVKILVTHGVEAGNLSPV